MESESAAISIRSTSQWRLVLSAISAATLVASVLFALSQFAGIRYFSRPTYLEITLAPPPHVDEAFPDGHRAAPMMRRRMRAAAHHRVADTAIRHRRSAAIHRSVAGTAPATAAFADSRPSLSAPATIQPGRNTGNSGNGALAAIGAHAIYAPMPDLPPDLSDRSMKAVAVAKFDVAPDGSVSVALVRATANPRLNYLLLQTLRRWRFFPALMNGKAVASQIELRIPVTIQ